VATGVYFYFKSLACGIAAFFSGVLIDIDHIFDCYVNHGIRFNLRNLYEYCESVRFRRLALVFHSFELIIILWALIFIFDLGDIWKAVTIGITHHVSLDHIGNWMAKKLAARTFSKPFPRKEFLDAVKEVLKELETFNLQLPPMGANPPPPGTPPGVQRQPPPDRKK